MSPQHSFVSVSADHVIVETVKRAEDRAPSGGPGNGDGSEVNAWIVRVYDWQQRRSSGVRLKFGSTVRHAVACNLIEKAEAPARYEGNDIIFDIKPFEIKTFKVWLS